MSIICTIFLGVEKNQPLETTTEKVDKEKELYTDLKQFTTTKTSNKQSHPESQFSTRVKATSTTICTRKSNKK